MAMLKIPVTKEDHIQGDMNAPITLVEYGDYQCPFCGAAYLIIKQVQKHFGKKLCFVFRNFPLIESHPLAELSAETAEFAGAHKRFWEAHDLIYENQDRLSPELLFELMESLQLPTAEYKKALQLHTYQEKIKQDFLGGVRSGVNGTPTFYVNGQRYNGSFEFEGMVQALQSVLNT